MVLLVFSSLVWVLVLGFVVAFGCATVFGRVLICAFCGLDSGGVCGGFGSITMCLLSGFSLGSGFLVGLA